MSDQFDNNGLSKNDDGQTAVKPEIATLLRSTKFKQWLTKVRTGLEKPVAKGNQGIIWRYQTETVDLAVKTIDERSVLRWFHRRSLNNEYQIYKKLQHLNGVATCYGMLDKRTLVLAFVKGDAYRQAQFTNRKAWFEALDNLVNSMHKAGIAHGDLKRKENLIVGVDEQPWVLDFGTAVVRHKGWRPINHWLFRFCCKLDNNAVIKHKYHGHYDHVQGIDLQRLQFTLPERFWRWLRPILGIK